jgi:hypothetical protein
VAGQEGVIVMTVAKLLGAVAALSLSLVVVSLAMGAAPDDRAGPRGPGAFAEPAAEVQTPGPMLADDPADWPAATATPVAVESQRGVTRDEVLMVAGIAAVAAAVAVGVVAALTHTHHGGGRPTTVH